MEQPEVWTAKRVLRRAVVEQRSTMARACLLLVGHQVGEALVPVTIGVVVDRAVATGDTASPVRWVIVLVCVFAVLSLSY